jgi:hypothetical protein
VVGEAKPVTFELLTACSWPFSQYLIPSITEKDVEPHKSQASAPSLEFAMVKVCAA